MIYVLELKGKGDDRADSVKFHVFDSPEAASAYAYMYTDESGKYWTRFIMVSDMQEIDNLYREY